MQSDPRKIHIPSFRLSSPVVPRFGSWTAWGITWSATSTLLLGACRRHPARARRRVQLRGGARWPHARRTLCTLSVRSRAPYLRRWALFLALGHTGAHDHRLKEAPVQAPHILEAGRAHERGHAVHRDGEVAALQDHRPVLGAICRRDLECEVILSPSPGPHLPQTIAAPRADTLAVWLDLDRAGRRHRCV